MRDGVLVDRAFADDLALAPAASIPVAGPVGVLDALGAAALARAVDVPAEAIAAALAGFRVGRHRAEAVGVVDGVTYVDDSKATNPHAAQASIAGLSAGGLGGRRPAQGRLGRRHWSPGSPTGWSVRC